MDAEKAKADDAKGRNPEGMEEGRPGGRLIRQKAAVHHHRIVGRIGKDLQQCHDQKHPTVIRPRHARRAQHCAKLEPRAQQQRTEGKAEDHKKDQHLHHVCAQRGRQPAPCRIAKAQSCNDQHRQRAGPRPDGLENQRDDQQIGKNLRQQPQPDHEVIGRCARPAEMAAQPVLHRARPAAAQVADDIAARQERSVIGRIGQCACDTVEIAQDRRVHQAAGENPRGNLAQHQHPKSRRAAHRIGAAKEAFDCGTARRDKQAGKDDSREENN